MSKSVESTSTDTSESSLYKILKNCVNLQSSYENLPIEEYDVCASVNSDYYKMIPTPTYLTANATPTSNYASEDLFGENIIEENGRISLAYENLCSIPRRIAEKFAAHTRCLDLSYNNFQNLSFLSFFEDLHTLILDHNNHLSVNTLPYLPNLKILWINNCNISDVTSWTQRIQMQCPLLEQLSIMGNPGIKNLFNISTLSSNSLKVVQQMPTSVMTNYREYILYVLPNLEYLDGLSRFSHIQSVNQSITDFSRGKSISKRTNTASISVINSNSSSENNHHNGPQAIRNFKDLFRLKRRKKSYQSSSTN